MNITQCSQSKTAFQTVTSEGPDITTFGFVTDTYIHTYIYLGAGKHPGPLCIKNK